MQLAKFLDFESNIPNKAVMVNNYDWMKEYTFELYSRRWQHITVNYMMAKDSVKDLAPILQKECLSPNFLIN